MAVGAIAIVSLILLSVLVFALASFIAKHRSVAALKLLPGRKPSFLFGNALQLTGEAHGEYYYILVYDRDREVTYKHRVRVLLPRMKYNVLRKWDIF